MFLSLSIKEHSEIYLLLFRCFHGNIPSKELMAAPLTGHIHHIIVNFNSYLQSNVQLNYKFIIHSIAFMWLYIAFLFIFLRIFGATLI